MTFLAETAATTGEVVAPVPAPAPVTRAWIRPEAVRAILDAYVKSAATEPCGVLLGRERRGSVRVADVVVLPNVHPAPDRSFLMDPEGILRATKDARAADLEVVGTWHGHVRGGPWPGRADHEAALGPASAPPSLRPRVLVIVGRGTRGRPVLRAFSARASDGSLFEIPLSV
jgi:proteasome lid subunit RPN8/RPN11